MELIFLPLMSYVLPPKLTRNLFHVGCMQRRWLLTTCSSDAPGTFNSHRVIVGRPPPLPFLKAKTNLKPFPHFAGLPKLCSIKRNRVTLILGLNVECLCVFFIFKSVCFKQSFWNGLSKEPEIHYTWIGLSCVLSFPSCLSHRWSQIWASYCVHFTRRTKESEH